MGLGLGLELGLGFGLGFGLGRRSSLPSSDEPAHESNSCLGVGVGVEVKGWGGG